VINRASKIIVIKSELSELQKVENFINECFSYFGLSLKLFNKVYLCISEAVINAIKHGNLEDSEKKVSIQFMYDEPEIEVRIEDEGEGFCLEKVENPTLQENIFKESGRGIYIIKALTNNIEYNETGNCIQFKIICNEQN